MKLSQMTDLTRWNRAGLSRFRYIDGNAVTYLETLRQQLAHLFDQGNGPSWQELVTRFPELADETRRETRKRLLDQYYDERRDYAWEILRSFARSAHVLGEYLDAYANEAYLPTAVEWDNLRKLVGLLGYRPAPPASAQTQVALLFKTGESGEVAAGFALKNQPAAGAPTVIFETADKLQGSADLNRLYLLDWDKNPTPIGSGAAIDFPLETLPEGLSVGDLGVLARPGKGVPVVLSAIDTEAPALSLQPLAGQPDGSFRYHNTELHLQPGLVVAPLANGERQRPAAGEHQSGGGGDPIRQPGRRLGRPAGGKDRGRARPAQWQRPGRRRTTA